MDRIFKGLDPISELSGVRCYEQFSNNHVAFARNGSFYYGPIDKLSELFAGDEDGFLIDDEAEEKVAELHAAYLYQAGEKIVASETDGMTTTRARWAKERKSGQWAKKTE
jgi:hypothetical protein